MNDELTLPWVEYKKDIDEHEMELLVEDAANLFYAISNYDMLVKAGFTENEITDQNADSLLILAAMGLYHMTCQVLDISYLMNPMKLTIVESGITLERGRSIICQVAKAYTHYVEGSMKYQRDLYQVIAMLAELLYGTFTNDEILFSYQNYLKYMTSTESERLGTRMVINL